MGSPGWRLKWGQGLGEGPDPAWTSSPQMYSKDRQWGLVGIILFFFVGVNLGKDGSFPLRIDVDIEGSLSFVELYK